MIQNLKEKNYRKAFVIYSIEIICFYLYIFVLFLIGYFYFQFPSNGVEGPGNEFIPIFRMFFMIFIFMIPFIGFLTYLGYSWNENESNFSLRVNQINKMIPFYLGWSIIWPGLFFVLGYYSNILGIIFNASEPLSPYWNVYWLLFLVVGRISDVIQLRYLQETHKIDSIKQNAVIQFFLYFSIDLIIILVAFSFQVLVFLFSLAIIAPFILIIQTLNYNAPWIVGAIPGIILVIEWSVFSSSAYILCLFLRGRLRYILLHPTGYFKKDFSYFDKNEKLESN